MSVKTFASEVTDLAADAKALHDQAEALMVKANAEAQEIASDDPHYGLLQSFASGAKAAHDAAEALSNALAVEEQVVEDESAQS